MWYLEMYRLLERSRGPSNYIPLSEILACANNFDLIGTKQEFISIMHALDDVYVKHFEKAHK